MFEELPILCVLLTVYSQRFSASDSTTSASKCSCSMRRHHRNLRLELTAAVSNPPYWQQCRFQQWSQLRRRHVPSWKSSSRHSTATPQTISWKTKHDKLPAQGRRDHQALPVARAKFTKPPLPHASSKLLSKPNRCQKAAALQQILAKLCQK